MVRKPPVESGTPSVDDLVRLRRSDCPNSKGSKARCRRRRSTQHTARVRLEHLHTQDRLRRALLTLEDIWAYVL